MVRCSRRTALRAAAGVIAGTVAGCNTPSDFTNTPTSSRSPTPTEERTPTPKPREPFDAAHGPRFENVTPIEKHIHELTNEARRRRELPGLTWHSGLAYAGRIHARDMGRRDYLDHINKDNQGPPARAAEYGVWEFATIGENIAVHPPGAETQEEMAKKLFDLWRNSESHWGNILKPDYTHHGTGVYITETGKAYAAQEFGQVYPQPDTAPINWGESMKNWSNTPTYAPDSPMRNNSSE
jgi:uncharacterized protein YkwD